MASITAFLRSEVFPKLDAAAANLFASYSPELDQTGECYRMTCPNCKGKNLAIYIPGTDSVECRKKEEGGCGRRTSVWDTLEKAGVPRRDVPNQLAKAAKVELPPRDTATAASTLAASTISAPAAQVPTPQPSLSPSTPEGSALRAALCRVLRECLWKSDTAQEYLIKTRGWSHQEIRRAPIGYFPSVRIVSDRLREIGVRVDQEMLARVVDSRLEQRIAWVWDQPDGIKIWGFGFGAQKAELVTPSPFRVDIPAFFEEVKIKHSHSVVVVTDPLQAARLLGNGIAAVATKAGHVTKDQAPLLVALGAPFVIYQDPTQTAGHAATERSVMRLSELGVPVRVLEGEAGWGSAERAIQLIGSNSFHAAIVNAVNGGVWLAARVAAQIERERPSPGAYIKARTIGRTLTGETHAGFFGELARRGIRVGLDVAEACRTFSALYELGIPIEQISDLVARHTGVRVSIQLEERGNNHGNPQSA